jgi:CHAT domain-containing protein
VTDEFGPLGLAIAMSVLIPENAASMPNLPSTPDNTPARKFGFVVFKSATDIAAGRFTEAEQRLSKCLLDAKDGADRLAEAACSVNLGAAHGAQGHYKEAQANLEHAEALYRQLDDQFAKTVDAPPDSSIGSGYLKHRSEYQQFARLGRQLSQLNLGTLSAVLGQLEQAEGHFERAFHEWSGSQAPGGRAAPANELVRIYRRLGNRDLKADALEKEFGDGNTQNTKAGFGGFEFRGIQIGAIREDPLIAGNVNKTAKTSYPFGWTAYGEELGVGSEAALGPILDDAAQEASNGNRPEAIRRYAVAARRAAAAGRPELEFRADFALMALYFAAGSRGAAIWYGKRAVNLVQAVRLTFRQEKVDRDARRSYLRERREVYGQLTSLLLDQQRMSEAEQVLQRLREDEGTEFVDSTIAGTQNLLSLSEPEARASRLFEGSVERFRSIDRQRTNASHATLFGVKLLAEGRESIERGRLALAKSLPEAMTAIRVYSPQRFVDDMRAGLPAILDAEISLFGSRRRLEAIFQHLLEDVPRFAIAHASPEQTLQLRENLRAAKMLPALLCPYMRGPGCGASEAVELAARLSSGAAASPSPNWNDTVIRALLDAEALESFWRADDSRRQLEKDIARLEDAFPSLIAETGQASIAATVDTETSTERLLDVTATNTALLYYLPGRDFLDILLVTPKLRKTWRVQVSEGELDGHIERFQRMLRSPQLDPRQEAQALYGILFQPVVHSMEESGIRRVAVSLSGRLRYIPFAALFDGKQWLVERFSIGLYLGGPISNLLSPSKSEWNVSAFGISSLPTVPNELRGVVRDEKAGSEGVLSGRIALDGAFTARALHEATTSSVRVVHLATHFLFNNTDPLLSTLQLGDGTQLTLAQLARDDYRFDRTDLVTLSACETGISVDDRYGQEVDGLASLFMRQGAKSVLASLWIVEDESTANLMTGFYRQRVFRGRSRVEALQLAQLELLRTAERESMPKDRQSGAIPIDRSGKALGERSTLGLRHPYYWAPFVLMGALL